MLKTELKLSQTSRKALCVQVGESAGNEIAHLLQSLADRLEQLERTKVNVTPIAPANSINLISTLADQYS
jgi:hypothetical protein